MTQNAAVPNKEVLDMLVEITRYGARFYDQSAERVNDRGLKSLFMRIAEAKHALVRNFTGADEASRAPLAASGSLLGASQRQYAEIRDRIGSGSNYRPCPPEREEELLKWTDKQCCHPDPPAPLKP